MKYGVSNDYTYICMHSGILCHLQQRHKSIDVTFFFHVQVDISQHDRKIIEEIDVGMCEIVCDVFSGPCPVNQTPKDHS